jgi:hypothetical protein
MKLRTLRVHVSDKKGASVVPKFKKRKIKFEALVVEICCNTFHQEK